MTQVDQRPKIGTIRSGTELKRWYWRKAELMDRARELVLPVTGAKFDLLDRIAHFLDHGEHVAAPASVRRQESKFNWQLETLSLETLITDNYRSTQNVRKFFQQELGAEFRFSIAFMEWIKGNTGKTLEEACYAYLSIRSSARQKGAQSKIKAHNQFNQYARNFIEANPGMGMKEVRQCWLSKTELPSENGRHVYDGSDLEFLPASPGNTHGKNKYD